MYAIKFVYSLLSISYFYFVSAFFSVTGYTSQILLHTLYPMLARLRDFTRARTVSNLVHVES